MTHCLSKHVKCRLRCSRKQNYYWMKSYLQWRKHPLFVKYIGTPLDLYCCRRVINQRNARMLYFDKNVRIFDQHYLFLSRSTGQGGLTMRNVRSLRQPKILNDPLAPENWASQPSSKKFQEMESSFPGSFVRMQVLVDLCQIWKIDIMWSWGLHCLSERDF